MQRSGWWTEVACWTNTYPTREKEEVEVVEQEGKKIGNEEVSESKGSKQASTAGKDKEQKDQNIKSQTHTAFLLQVQIANVISDAPAVMWMWRLSRRGREASTDGGRGDESDEECRMDGGRRREPLGRMPSCPAN